ncbi:MAG: DegQ family serine endoprotease [Thermoanaerobaculia bacterium]
MTSNENLWSEQDLAALKRFRILVVLVLVVGIGGVWAWTTTHTSHHAELHAASPSPAPAHRPGFEARRGVIPQEGFSEVLAGTRPAVVNISSSRTVRLAQGGDLNPFFNDPFFRQFFGDQFRHQVPRERRERGLGSGVVVSNDGYILTNNHVVDGADEVRVALADKREFDARIVGRDAKIDIAVLKIEAADLPALTFADSNGLQVGDIVLAIGNPFGIGQTVTMGIVSATGRGGLGIEDYEDFIQTDAAINPGNSGGALIDADGRLVGINTAILSQGAPGNVGIGFAVPINMARQAMDQILKHGRVVRGFLGVVVQPVTPAIAKAFELAENRGALVGDVAEDTPAERAGIEKGDVILQLAGEPVEDSRDLQLKIAQAEPGSEVRLHVLRDGRERDLTVKLDELPSELAEEETVALDSEAPEGIAVQTLTPGIARQLDLPPETRGVVVAAVEPGSPWSEAGLRRGDVIEEVDREPVIEARAFDRVLRSAGDKPLLLLVNRGGNTLFVAVELD